MKAHLAADLAVDLSEDRPGALAKAISCIATAGINIDGYSEMNGVVHVLTTELQAARAALGKAGFHEVHRGPGVSEDRRSAHQRQVQLPGDRKLPGHRLEQPAAGHRSRVKAATDKSSRTESPASSIPG
jgi:hypothetical protein